MKIIKVRQGGAATTGNPDYNGSIVTDGITANYFDHAGVMWYLPQELVNTLDSGVAQEAVSEELEIKKEVSITDLLALKTTYHIDDIVKLKENGLL